VLLFAQLPVTSIIATILIMLFSMSIHEFGHAAMATYWGDDTPKRNGRLTLNPLVHINWIGFAMFVLIGFGILGSVPVNPSRMRSPRWGSFWTSFAGPLTNLAVALAAALLLRLFFAEPTIGLQFFLNSDRVPLGSYQGLIPDTVMMVLVAIIFWNVLLFLFNLLPFFPIDGWHMVLALLPGYWLRREQVPSFLRGFYAISQFLQQPAYKWQQWAAASQMVLLILIMIGFILPGFSILGRVIFAPAQQLWLRLIGIV
jgi:Zn-dependent protease